MTCYMNKSIALTALIPFLFAIACGPEEQDQTPDETPDQSGVIDMGTAPEDQGTSPEDQGSTPEDQGTTPEDMGSPSDQGSTPEDIGSSDDQGVPEDMGGEEDLIVIGDLGTPDPEEFPCFEELNQAWPWNTGVTPSGEVTVTDNGGVTTATIAATGGGRMNALNEAFVYVDLDSGTLVNVDDLQALSDTTWDLAFKRVVIRSNAGTSGPGKVAVAKLTETTFDAVTSVPSDASFIVENNTDDQCAVALDPLNTPITVFNQLNADNPTGSQSWYDYGGPGGGLVPSPGVIYLVRNAEDTATFKLEIVSWSSGVFELEWAVVQ